MRNRIPTSGYDELELAIVGMRERFFSIAEHISGLLAVLAQYVDAAPPHARASVGNAASQIAGTQERLRAQLSHLPPRPEQRYQIMQSLLQAQEGALQQLTIIVEQHTPQAPGPMPYAQAPWTPEQPSFAPPQVHATRRGKAPRARRRREERAERRGTLIEMIVSRRLAVVAGILAAVVAAYFYAPDLYALFERAHRKPVVAIQGGDVTKLQESLPATTPPSIGSEGRKLPGAPGIILTPPRSRLEPVDAGSTATSPPAVEEAPTVAVAPVPAVIETGAIEPAPPQRFVAVVFTHQDSAEALSTFADLQHRYPSLLGRRKAEAQPIEIGDKGIWHRLVVLPAGSRQSARGLCDQLTDAGYDRCWVKAY